MAALSSSQNGYLGRSHKLAESLHCKTKSACASVVEKECTARRQHGCDLLGFGRNRGIKHAAKSTAHGRTWKPAALRAPVLLTAILISVTLVVVLQLLLRRSQTEGAIFFTSGARILTPTQAFWIIYLPTIIAVLLSIFWSWIDLDTKRFEPYHQLAKPGGALGKDCLLLQYPFDFIASVPIKSLRHRHWPVFFASTAIVCIFWGLTPSQAGMFVPTVVDFNKTDVAMKVSTGFRPLGQQQTQPFANYTYTAFAVNFLGAMLPGYMADEYAIAPFEPLDWAHEVTMGDTWKAPTTQYGAEVLCAEPGIKLKPDVPSEEGDLPENSFYTSWTGCEVPRPFGPTGAEVVGGEGASNETKQFSIFVATYANDADLGLSPYCPSNASRTFFVSFSKNRISPTDPPSIPVVMFCEAAYYARDVNATLFADGLYYVATSTPISNKRPVPEDLFDIPNFERQVFSHGSARRREIPGSAWPNMTEHLSAIDITLQFDGKPLPPIAALSLGSRYGIVPPESFLDRDALHTSFQKAYQLLFGIAIADVLKNNVNESEIRTGQRTFFVSAEALDPTFTRIVQGLLGLIALLAMGLLQSSWSKSRKLLFNPAPVAAVMSLVADSTSLLQALRDHDLSTTEQLESSLGNETFQLVLENDCSILAQVSKTAERKTRTPGPRASSHPKWPWMRSTGMCPTQRLRGIRPSELRLLTTAAFATFQLGLIVGLAVIYVKAKPYGFYWVPKVDDEQVEEDTVVTSESEFITQFLYSYLPIAVAAFIEPFWVVINRQLCLLQPFEDLRRGNAPPNKTISIDYLSLPPQLNIWRALSSGHALLATVCVMALLANVLAVAFGGLFFFTTGDLPIPMEFVQSRILSIADAANFSAPPGSIRQHQIAQLNLISGKWMPDWTDDEFMYLPFFPPGYDPVVNDSFPSTDQQAKTRAFGAQLDCIPLSPGSNNSYSLKIIPDRANAGLAANLTTDVRHNNPIRLSCSSSYIKINNSPQTAAGCPEGPVAIEFVNTMTALEDASPEERAFCEQYVVVGWVRNAGPNVCATMGYVKPEDATVLGCRPRLVTGIAEVRTDFQGIKGRPRLENVTSEGLQQYFSDNPGSLITRIQQFFPGNEATWHNDSFPSDFSNYLMMKISNDTRMLNPSMPPPLADNAAILFERLYSKLVAIYLGTYRNQLLASSVTSTPTTLAGFTFDPQIRVFMSTPMFILAEVILCIYVVVTILVYLHRPERFLPRLPTTIASIIATFAAGYAVHDFQGTAHLGTTERNLFTEKLGTTYAYGSFMGTDGKPHTGIEKEPLVTPLKHSTSSSGQLNRRPWRRFVAPSSTSSFA